MPAVSLRNAKAFQRSLAPTGACMKNLDVTRRTCPVHRHCVATGRATLVVYSASSHASGSFEQQTLDGFPAVKGTYTDSVRGFALAHFPAREYQQPPHSFRRCLCTQACMTGYQPAVVLPAGLLLTPPNTTGRT